MNRLPSNIGSSIQQLRGNRFHVNRIALTKFEVRAHSVTSTGVGHDEVLISPFFSQDLSESVVVRDGWNTIPSRNGC